MKEETFKIRFSNFMERLYKYKKLEANLSYGHNWAPGRLPFDSGDLSQVAFTMEKIDDSHYVLKIDTSMTPYAITIDQKRNFYTNNYWDLFAQSIADDIAAKWGGTMDNGGAEDGNKH